MTASQPLDPWIGRSVGDRYQIKQRIGGGGMGEVFAATDTLLGQQVALKILNERLASEEVKKRFEREVVVSAALRSDHIVQVFDYGVTAQGHPFYVMEYLEGQTLGQLLRRETRLPLQRIIRIMTQICSGLYMAHQGVCLRWHGTTQDCVKVIHRDLKPDNIFLVPTRLGEFVKILDFGIAKLHSEQMEQTHLTSMFMGTYQYASPEQLTAAKTLDERADIYSLGMLLYRMLSGTTPFYLTSQQEPQLSGAMWAVAHLTKSPLPLRQQPNCEHWSEQLEAVVMKCLAKSPDQRFASVLELERALCIATHYGSVDGSVGGTELHPEQGINTIQQTSLEDGSDASPTTLAPPTSTDLSDRSESSETSATEIYQPALIGTKIEAETQPRQIRLRHSLSRLILWLASLGGLLTAATVLTAYLFQTPLSLPKPEVNPELNSNRSTSQPPVTSPDATTIDADAAAKTLTGHTDGVWAVAVSPDGKTIVSGGQDKTLRIWNAQTGELQRTLAGHTDAIRAIAISPNGKLLVSSSGDKTIKIWDARTGSPLRTFSGHSGPVWTVAISPDNTTLASGSYDGTIKIWNLQTGQLLRTLPEHYDSIWTVAISPDNKILASGSYDSTIKIWNLQTGQLLRTLTGHFESVRSIAISPDSQTLVSGSWDKTVKIWNLPTGALQRTLSGHSSRVVSVAISADGQTIATGSIDHTIKTWNLTSGELLHTLTGHSDWVVAVATGPDPNAVVSASRDKTVKLWR